MINKHHLILLLILIISTFSISIKPKNADNTPKPPNKQEPEAASQQYGEADNSNNGEATPKPKEIAKKSAKQTKEESKQSDKSDQPSKQTQLSKEPPKEIVKNSKNNKKSGVKTSKQSTNQKSLSNNRASHKKVAHQEALQSSNTISKDNELIYEHSFWGKFLLYLLIIGTLCYGTKYVYFPRQNLVQTVIDLLIIASSLFNSKKKGYQPPKFTEQIDDENTITVGYNEEHGRQLFWERNSVQGI